MATFTSSLFLQENGNAFFFLRRRCLDNKIKKKKNGPLGVIIFKETSFACV